MRILQTGILFSVLALAGPLAATEKLADGLYAEFTTPHGAVLAELYYQKVPLTVASFVGLAEGTLAPRDGHPFYTGLTWYRVVPGFVIQSGNPGLKDTGDESIPHKFADELVPGLRHQEIGTLSMANAGPDTNGCEFFITLGDDTRLNYLHSVFGRTVRGVEVLPQIKPDEAFSIKILRVGPAAKAFKADPGTFQALAAQAGKYQGEAEPGPAAHFDDPDKLLPQDVPRAKNFNYKLNNFQRFTGVRVCARLFAKAPSAAEDAQPGAFMHALATKLGVDRRGAVAAYFAEEDDWRVWFGEESTPALLGRASTAADLVPEGSFHRAKEPFLAAARAAGDAAYARQVKAAPPGQPPPAAQKLKLQTDALLDALLLQLEPK
jgi:cyclophilin family peptidyl-prolyl cis-trans isomerase